MFGICTNSDNRISHGIGDHLGSTGITTDTAGVKASKMRYTAWGEVRYQAGTTSTGYTYTGQYSDSYINLLDYGSRRYDPELGRFIQPDSIIPGSYNPQAYDRYSYVFNNPIKYTDPSGHSPSCDDGEWDDCGDETSILTEDDPITWDTGNIIIIVMPSGNNPTMPRPDIAKKIGTNLGIAGLLFDAGEMIGIFTPIPGGEDLAAFSDIVVTYFSSLSSGQSYFLEKPHPDVPRMLSVNQDVIVTTGDAVAAAAAKGVLGILAGPAGVAVGKGVDFVTTGASIAYDHSRVFGSTPNYITVGISVDFDETFGNGVIMIWQQP